MNVLIISQCNKLALTETRRIVDQFAERKGERTWQTAITENGLETLRQLLRKTARRNTAVVCHWIKSANRTELLWIVGNSNHFNEYGAVPTNVTTRDVLRSHNENLWHTGEDIAILAGIAGLFHDFGKANPLFQKKLRVAKKQNEPYRHEWISLLLFVAFVKGLSDQQWLEKLAQVNANDEKQVLEILEGLMKDSSVQTNSYNPFSVLSSSPLAKTIGWLVVSHHRLPKCSPAASEPRIDHIQDWMTHDKEFNSSWNSPQCEGNSWSAQQYKDIWTFPQGTPLRSRTWRAKAHALAQRALKRPTIIKDWLLEDRFSSHLSRLVLMLADHCYSAEQPKVVWQDKNYRAYANTDSDTGKLKQKLDEHNVGVGHNAERLAKILPELRQTLPAITRHKGFKKRSTREKFRWQDKAYDLACAIRQRSSKHGFFGVNMASTGCGKTFANGRIMYGLANERLGCRFSVALGLRTLTLQTGEALRKRLNLTEDDLAVLIGSQAVKELYKNKDEDKDEDKENPYIASGSESAAAFYNEYQYVRYEGSLDDGRLSHWLKRSPKSHQLLSAPILVSTIDHLIPATEGERGGKQITPMLRLMTADLVLDEPDDFDLADLPALARLVNWAGMLGARVLLSSATLPPSLIEALFEAYLAGRKIYQTAVGEADLTVNVCCGWFDEYAVLQSDHQNKNDFMQAHTSFVTQRVHKLNQVTPLRRAKLLPVEPISSDFSNVILAIAQCLSTEIPLLHQLHHQMHPQTRKRLSIGLVRMANINQLVAMAKQLFAISSLSNYRLHYCVYHSQYPLAMRSYIEEQLDLVLTRHQPDQIWQVESIRQALNAYPEENHIFIVLATPVAEVGRDHDYDWAIAEPSSMRSLIQLAGRIQRHRQQAPEHENMLVLTKNYNALVQQKPAYQKPGFESKEFKLISHDLREILLEEQLRHINAVPRIQERDPGFPSKNLADLEHQHLRAKLFGSQGIRCHASLWWQESADWSFEIQRRTLFRQSPPNEQFVLYFEEEGEEAEFHISDIQGGLKAYGVYFKKETPLSWGDRVQPWFAYDFCEIIMRLAERFDMNIAEASRKFGEVRLREQSEWIYHPMLGVFGVLS